MSAATKYTRVAYGEDVPPEQMPYFVTIMIEDFFFGPATCGGTIIDRGILLTAAHCIVDDYRDTYFDSYVMLKNGTDENGTNTYVETDVLEYAIPDAYFPAIQPYADQFYGDIALLKIDPNLTKHRVRLPSSPEDLDEAPILVGSGKGLTEDKKLSKKLEFVSVQKLQEVPNSSRLVLEEDHFIAKDRKNQDTCVGDSGGPLLVPSKNWNTSDTDITDTKDALPPFDVQVGIVSYGEGRVPCGENNSYGVYTDIMYWKDWIDMHLIRQDYGDDGYNETMWIPIT